MCGNAAVAALLIQLFPESHRDAHRLYATHSLDVRLQCILPPMRLLESNNCQYVPMSEYVARPPPNAPTSKHFDVRIPHNTAWVHLAVMLLGFAFCSPVGLYQASKSVNLC